MIPASPQGLARWIAHPASDTLGGLAFDNGAEAWLILRLQPNQVALFELLLTQGDSRHSVGVVYGKDGRLFRTESIR